MAATVTLSTTTLSVAVNANASSITVASTSGLTSGTRLFIDRELLTVVSLGVGTAVNVLRGVDGTSGAAHASSSVVTIGRADQFYQSDPIGAPPAAIPVSPYINVITGAVWFAQGDQEPSANTNRWWQLQTSTYDVGPLGSRTLVQTPTSST